MKFYEVTSTCTFNGVKATIHDIVIARTLREAKVKGRNNLNPFGTPGFKVNSVKANMLFSTE